MEMKGIAFASGSLGVKNWYRLMGEVVAPAFSCGKGLI